MKQITRITGAILAFLGAFTLMVPNLAAGAWLADETYYMITGQEYVEFLLNPNRSEFARHILAYLNTPSQEATGLVNHPFFGKLVIGSFTLASGVSVSSNYCSIYPFFYLCPLNMPTAQQLFWARLPSTLAAASTIAIVFYMVASQFGFISATLGSLFLLCDATFLQYSRLAMLDIYAATFLTASVAVAVSSPSLGGKRLTLLGILVGLMLASKFALGVLIAFMFILGIVLKQGGLKDVIVFLMIGVGLFFLIDFYYALLPPSYLLTVFIATGRPIPANIGVSQGPLAAFLATFSWQAYYSIPHVWSLFEVALVTISLLIASFLRIRRRHDTAGLDNLFLASATLGLVTFTWERPLVLLAPLSAIFVATTIGQFSHKYMSKKISAVIQFAAIGALLIQLGALVPQAYFSHALFQYDASTYIPALLGLPPLRTSGEIVLSFLVLFAASTSVPLLNRKKRYNNPNPPGRPHPTLNEDAGGPPPLATSKVA